MEGVLIQAASKMSTTPSEESASSTIWRIAVFSSASLLPHVGVNLLIRVFTAWKKATWSFIRSAGSLGTAITKSFESAVVSERNRFWRSSLLKMKFCAQSRIFNLSPVSEVRKYER